jgi:hypothetical protein
MVTGYNPGCVFAPGKLLILHIKNHIYTKFNTQKNPLNPLHLALPIFTLFLSSEICRIKNKLKSGAKQPL